MVKITKSQLREIIREELLNEGGFDTNFNYKGKSKPPKLYFSLKKQLNNIRGDEFGAFFTYGKATGTFSEVDSDKYDITVDIMFTNKLSKKPLKFSYIYRQSTDDNSIFVTTPDNNIIDKGWQVFPNSNTTFIKAFSYFKALLK